MKVKVTKTFWDKHTGKKHRRGDEFEASEARVEEILRKGAYVKLVEAESAEAESAEEEKPVRKRKPAKKTVTAGK